MTGKMIGSEQALILSEVSIFLGSRQLLHVDAMVEPGRPLTIMGPSGSGKSSLLAYIAGFLDPAFTATGDVSLDGRSLIGLPPELRRVGMLFQDALLFPHMSVGQNLAFALAPQSASDRHERRRIIEDALKEAGLEGMYQRDPATLSGGQKSRVALMRVLLSRPRALLLDEPFSKLDAQLRSQIRDFVFVEAAKYHLPVLLVTHDGEDAAAAGGVVINLATACRPAS
jgi:putative thiamine transport system ATP-binding protein